MDFLSWLQTHAFFCPVVLHFWHDSQCSMAFLTSWCNLGQLKLLYNILIMIASPRWCKFSWHQSNESRWQAVGTQILLLHAANLTLWAVVVIGGAGGNYLFWTKSSVTLRCVVQKNDTLPRRTVKTIKIFCSACKILQNHNLSCGLGCYCTHTCKVLVTKSTTPRCAHRKCHLHAFWVA